MARAQPVIDSAGSVVAATAATKATAATPILAWLLLFASGAAALVWQIVWTSQLGVALGHEVVSVLAVMAAFFGGLAAGALLLAQRVERSPTPGRYYAALEAVIGSWALLICLVGAPGLPLLARWIGAEPGALWHWSIAFIVPFVTLLPATFAMGATLPAMERLLGGEDGHQIAGLYAANTAGAVAGLLLAVFVLIPQLGLFRTGLLFVGINTACALLAWWAWGHCHRSRADAVVDVAGVADAVSTTGDSTGAATAGKMAAAVTQGPASPKRFMPARGIAPIGSRLFFSGLLGVGYEVLAVRVLAEVTENTVYTYALLLSDFLIGTTIGAALAARANSPAVSLRCIDRAVGLLLAAIALGGASLWWADRSAMAPLRWFGPGLAPALAGELVAGALAMMPPALAMGALFTLLCRQAREAGMPLGLAFGVNTIGSAVAPVAIGLLLLPVAGAKVLLLMLFAGYLCLRSRASWRRPFGWCVAAAVAGAALLAPPLRFIDLPEGGRLLRYQEGVMAAVSVVEDAQGVARLHINNRVQEGSSASGQVEIRLAELPLLLHDAPRNVLFLGYGTGYTAHAAARDPALTVKAVELLPEVIEAADLFGAATGSAPGSQMVTTVAADARRYVQASASRYDVIVSDLFHPARNGAGSLYTVEHFAATRARLAAGGLFCQWLALYQMDLATLRSIVPAYLQVFPGAVAVLASNSLDTPVLGLIARPDAPHWAFAAVRHRIDSAPPAVASALRQAHLDDAYAVLGSVVAGPTALHRFARGTAANTDDFPLVAQRAPWASYFSAEPARARLALLSERLTPTLPEVLRNATGVDATRLQAYWQARADYLRLGLRTTPQSDPGRMLDQLGAPLLRIVATSPDFHPAAEPLMALSRAVRPADARRADQVDAALRRALSTPPISDPFFRPPP